MNRKMLFIIIIYFFIHPILKAQSLSSQQTKDIELSISAFMSAIAEYSNCKGENELRKQIQVKELHDGNDETDLIFNDLFSTENNGGAFENYNWGQYFATIKNDFHNEIHVEYKNISVLNCTVRNGNNFYVYATVDKTLSYKTQNSSYTILISVNLSNQNAIKEIVSPNFYKNNKNGTCDIGIDKTDVASQVNLLRAIADNYFFKKDFLNAKNSYLAISTKLPNDLTVKNKIGECDKLISFQSILDKANDLYMSKKYEASKQLYQDLLNNYPEADKSAMRQKIILNDKAIIEENYKQQIELADYYYRVANFEEARKHYGLALNFKQNDSYSVMQLQNSKNGDKTFVRNEISRAVQLAEAGKKNYAKAFKIMTDYELSGLLSTDNYAFLTLMMFSKNRDIKNELNYTRDNFENYFNIYVKKLKAKNAIEPTEQANFLLTEVINKRYQN